jgi:hypothetical protein
MAKYFNYFPKTIYSPQNAGEGYSVDYITNITSRFGFETEFKNFKKHKDYENVIDLLIPAIENQSKWKSIEFELNEWTAQWKNLSTWINQRCWEDEPTEQVRNVITQRDKVKSIKINDVEAIYEGLNL